MIRLLLLILLISGCCPITPESETFTQGDITCIKIRQSCASSTVYCWKNGVPGIPQQGGSYDD